MTDVFVRPDGSYVVRAEDANDVIWVVPGRPAPEPTATTPLRLWSTGTTSCLQGGFQWPISEKAIRRQAAGLWAEGGITGTNTQLRVGIEGVPILTVEVLGDSEAPRILVSIKSSSYPPYSAIVSTTVDEPIVARVREALHGHENRIRVSYRSGLNRVIPVSEETVRELAAQGVVITPERQVTATTDIAASMFHRDRKEKPC